MNAEDHFPWTPLVVSIAASLITALIIQLGGAIWWGSKIEATQTIHGNDISDLKIRMVALTEGGSKQDTILEQRIKVLEQIDNAHAVRMNNMDDRLNSINPLMALRLDTITANIARMDNRQDRFSDALDAAYSDLQEHLRNPNMPISNKPLPKHR